MNNQNQLDRILLLAEVASYLSTTNFENASEIFSSIGQRAKDIIGGDSFYIALYDKDNAMISFPYFIDIGVIEDIPSRKTSNGLTEYIIRTKTPLILSGVQNLGVSSWIGVPIVANDEVLGVIASQKYTIGTIFNDVDIRLLRIIANYLATAIINSRLSSQLLIRDKEYEEREKSYLDEINRLVEEKLEVKNLSLPLDRSETIFVSYASEDFDSHALQAGNPAEVAWRTGLSKSTIARYLKWAKAPH